MTNQGIMKDHEKWGQCQKEDSGGARSREREASEVPGSQERTASEADDGVEDSRSQDEDNAQRTRAISEQCMRDEKWRVHVGEELAQCERGTHDSGQRASPKCMTREQ